MKECGTAYWSKYEVKVALHHAQIIVQEAEKLKESIMEKHLAEEKAKKAYDDTDSESDSEPKIAEPKEIATPNAKAAVSRATPAKLPQQSNALNSPPVKKQQGKKPRK